MAASACAAPLCVAIVGGLLALLCFTLHLATARTRRWHRLMRARRTRCVWRAWRQLFS